MVWLGEKCKTEYGELEMYKERKSNRTIWLSTEDIIGLWLFTFDKKKVYNLFTDYPNNMTQQEVDIFSRENPNWRDFFSDRFGS